MLPSPVATAMGCSMPHGIAVRQGASGALLRSPVTQGGGTLISRTKNGRGRANCHRSATARKSHTPI